MPAPAVYLLAVIGTVAAGIAFKEFVYEPHIAPQLEKWADEFLLERRSRRRHRGGLVAVSVGGSGVETDSKRSDTESRDDHGSPSSIELETLVAQEVLDWRNQVDHAGLRRRNNATSPRQSAIDESVSSLSLDLHPPILPTSPTHVLFDSIPSTPTSIMDDLSYISHEPSMQVSGTPQYARSISTLRSPSIGGRLPTPDPSPPSSPLRRSNADLRTDPFANPFANNNTSGTPSAYGTATPNSALASPYPTLASTIPSLSLTHGHPMLVDLDLEILSAPSSSPSPFNSPSPYVRSPALSPPTPFHLLDDDSDSISSDGDMSRPISRISFASSGFGSEYMSFDPTASPRRDDEVRSVSTMSDRDEEGSEASWVSARGSSAQGSSARESSAREVPRR